MKKLVAIALIAAMATVANAAVGFTAASTDVEAGDIVTINLVGSGACAGFSISAVSDGGMGGVAGALTFNPTLTILGPGYLDNTAAGILFDTASAYAGGANVAAGGVLFSFTYAVSAGAVPGAIVIAPLAAGTQFVDVYGDTYTAEASQGNIGGQMQDISGITLNVIPEPMTLGLLGLGGLFLRRRLA